MLTPTKVLVLTSAALLAFASNSVLCRMALSLTQIDAASFTSIRLLSGVLVLLLICLCSGRYFTMQGSWTSAFALFVYAAGFSFAYQSLPTGIGALLLFGAVQTCMIGYGCWRGERLKSAQWCGLILALCGLLALLLPGATAPSLMGALLMIMAGAAWGVYSLRGRGAGDPVLLTTGNFVRALVFALVLSALSWQQAVLPSLGVMYAVISGALASGIGYVIWYAVLPHLPATKAATVQLSVPVIAAFAGVILLEEALTLRLMLSSVAILGGIALVMLEAKKPA